MKKSLKINIENKLKEITELLATNFNKYQGTNLMDGKPGIALFFFYLSKYINSDYYYNIGYNIVTDLLKSINNSSIYHTFAGGVAGIGWLMNHLVSNNLIDANTEEMFEDFDDFLFEKMKKDLSNNNYDFLHGAIGVGLYFKGKSRTIKTQHKIKYLVNELDDLSDIDKNKTIKWLSIIDHQNGTKGYNISMSHGIASIISFMSKINKDDFEKVKSRKLIDGSINYLINQKLNPNLFYSVFPNFAKESITNNIFSSRLAWCYGDLGISVAIWHASQALGRKDWEQESIDTILHAAKRRDLKQNLVVDAGLCHGTAGIAHIFNRIYYYTNREELKDASTYWYEHTLKMARFDDGLAGYKTWRSDKYGGWQIEAGLLEGIAGIGLALISAISDIEPAWDECLLLS